MNELNFSELIICVIVLFVMPLISLQIDKRVSDNKVNIFRYALYVSLNLLLSKLLFQLFCLAFSWENIIYNFQYMLTSFLVSFVAPYFVLIIKRRFSIDFVVNKNEEK